MWFQENSRTSDKGGASDRKTGLKRKANVFLNNILHILEITKQILWSGESQALSISLGWLIEPAQASWAELALYPYY